METLFFSLSLFLIVAVLYSSVGHAGGSGYLAIMALLAFSPPEIKPTALVLNVFVASIGTYQFLKSGYFDRKIFLRVAIFSFPAAFFGGYIMLNDTVFRFIAGFYLIVSALLLVGKVIKKKPNGDPLKPMSILAGATTGGVIGFFSGLIGMGGGVFLSPILLLFRWSNAKQTSGIASLFILLNSGVTLIGLSLSTHNIPNVQWIYLVPVIIGGIIGSYFGSHKLNPTKIYIILAIILFSAGLKMIPFS
jgi:uncharacterized protein